MMSIIFIGLNIFLRVIVVVEDFEEFTRGGFTVKLFYLPAPCFFDNDVFHLFSFPFL